MLNIKSLITIFLFLFIITGNTHANEPDIKSYGNFGPDWSYSFDDAHIYYRGSLDENYVVLEGADKDSFRVSIDYHAYAKDKNSVYYKGIGIIDADIYNIMILSNDYIKDNQNIFYQGEKIKQTADVATFDVIEPAYAFDSKNVYEYDMSAKYKRSDFIESNPNFAERISAEENTKDEQLWSWSIAEINNPKLVEVRKAGWLTGYPDGTLRLENPVNRAEFAKMLMMAFYKGEGSKGVLAKFPDVMKNVWYTPYLSRAVELKIMEGYPDGKMRPENTINKAEALKMALATAGKDYGIQKEGEAWYERYRRYAEENFKLDFTKPEDMDKFMTRGECVELILEAEEK